MTEQQEQPQQKEKKIEEKISKWQWISTSHEVDKVPVNNNIERGGTHVKVATIAAVTFEQDNVELSSLAAVLTTSAYTDPVKIG